MVILKPELRYKKKNCFFGNQLTRSEMICSRNFFKYET